MRNNRASFDVATISYASRKLRSARQAADPAAGSAHPIARLVSRECGDKALQGMVLKAPTRPAMRTIARAAGLSPATIFGRQAAKSLKVV
jgi:hypothetical protein